VSVRPELGPTLPALLAARGVSRRTMIAGAIVLLVVVVAGWLAIRSGRDRAQLQASGPPAFNLVYQPSVLHEAPRRPGELARLEGRRRDLSVEITVRPITVPRYARADVIGGYLPILAERRLHELAELYGPVEVYDEGKSRINHLPGYQIGFSARPAEGRLLGRDAYVFPDDDRATEGVLLSLRRVVRRRQTAADRDYFDLVKQAFTSFAFGSDQP